MPERLTAAQVAVIFHVGSGSVYRYLKRGMLSGRMKFVPTRHLEVDARSVRDWLVAHGRPLPEGWS